MNKTTTLCKKSYNLDEMLTHEDIKRRKFLLHLAWCFMPSSKPRILKDWAVKDFKSHDCCLCKTNISTRIDEAGYYSDGSNVLLCQDCMISFNEWLIKKLTVDDPIISPILKQTKTNSFENNEDSKWNR
jgi:hypothetical protein